MGKIMDWMRRRRKAIMIMAAIAAFSAKTQLANANNQIPQAVQNKPQVVKIEKQINTAGEHGDLKGVEKGVEKLKKEVKECTEGKCKIQLGKKQVPEFVINGDLDALYNVAGNFKDGKISETDFKQAIKEFKHKYGHDVEALMEARAFDKMLSEKS